MFNLNGIVPKDDLENFDRYTNLRLRDRNKFIFPEALTLYEQNYLPEEELHKLCEEAYGMPLERITQGFVENTFYNLFQDTGCVPYKASLLTKTIDVIVLKDLEYKLPDTPYTINIHYVPIYTYFKFYAAAYGYHPDLMEVPGKFLLENIVQEAVAMKAADITISSTNNIACVYYNTLVQHKVEARRIITKNSIQAIIGYLTNESPLPDNNLPHYVGVNLTDEYRGRVCINHKYGGFTITIRLQANSIFNKTLEDLGLTDTTIDFIRREFLDTTPGLRLIVGGTASGKNTTMLAALNELAQRESIKIVSVEQPVEQVLPNIEQLDTSTPEEFQAAIESLIRINPDVVYITEMNGRNAEEVKKLANIGKRVFTTLHSNSVEETLLRVQDITSLSTSQAALIVHSIIHQQLLPDPKRNSVYPRCMFVKLNPERATKLASLSSAEQIGKLISWKEGDHDARLLYASQAPKSE